MKIHVKTGDEKAQPSLLEPDDFKAFNVVVEGPPSGLAEAIAPVGELLESGDAMIRKQAVIDLAGERARDDDWMKSFEAMLAYAETKGWISPDGSSIQAHCEYL